MKTDGDFADDPTIKKCPERSDCRCFNHFWVNGEHCGTRSVRLSYDDLAAFTGEPKPTVVYTNGPKGRSGTLIHGEDIAVRSGMRFNARNTGAA